MRFPIMRMRRLRENEGIRRLVRETNLTTNDLIYPLFVVNGKNVKNPVKSMPGVYQLSVDLTVREARECYKLGILGVILFGIPAYKDEVGSSSYDENEAVQRAIAAIKKDCPEVLVITDICICEYTSHGHCGITKNGHVLNDPTLEILGKIALSHARAGADMVAPSAMMDGQVAFIRKILDTNGYKNIPIMAYSAKFASAYYGPFRDAAGSSPRFGDRRSYQMDFANANEAIREVKLDIEEGADIVMVKPALAYMDIIRRVKEEFKVPVAAYNVSGEYAMIKAATDKGWIDEKLVTMETLIAMKRAGADIILTYHAKDVASWLKEE